MSMKQRPTDTEILDWIQRERADVMPHTDEKTGHEEWGVSFGTLMDPRIAWGETLREAAIKAMGIGRK